MRHINAVDQIILGVDAVLKALFAPLSPKALRETPGIHVPCFLTPRERQTSIALMRINHTGEICAQALYQAQGLTARNKELAEKLKSAAKEEEDHLAWCAGRIETLGGRTSYLNPLFAMGSLGIGLLAGFAGDKMNLGFLAETEFQVTKHLERHLNTLPTNDTQSRAIVEQMRMDELAHATSALESGGERLPSPIRFLMTCASKIMTVSARYI